MLAATKIVPIDAASDRGDHETVERKLREAFYDWRRSASHQKQDPDYVYARFLENRIRALKTSIRRLLTSGVLTESQRTGLLITAYGTQTGTEKDAGLLTVVERRLIEKYRNTDNKGRVALRSLCDNLRDGGAA